MPSSNGHCKKRSSKCSSSSSSSSSSSCSSSSSSSSSCSSKSSSSCKKSSSSSSSCCLDKCDDKICKGIPPSKLYCKYRSAVVQIHSEFDLTALPATVVTTPVAVPPVDRVSYFIEGSGFFIKGHYIVCPAHLVLIPPHWLAVNYRYPYVGAAPLSPPDRDNATMTKVSRILVDVFEVNGGKASYSYEASLIGVDGAGDIAVLRIDSRLQYNLCSPCIKKCHPYFCLGDSRRYKPGQEVYAMGNAFSSFHSANATSGAHQIVEGMVADNRGIDYFGFAPQELVFTNLEILGNKSGLPLVDKFGRVIGMQTIAAVGVIPLLPYSDPSTQNFSFPVMMARGETAASGPSQFFMKRVLKALLCGPCKKSSNHVGSVNDALGSYYYYIKGYAGIAWEVVTGKYYDTTVNPVTGVRSIRYDPLTGAFLNSPQCKQLIGVQVVTLAGQAVPLVLYAEVPGAASTAPYPSGLLNSPFVGSILPGDIITYINGCPLGDLKSQIPPALKTWCTLPGDRVTLTYRKASDQYESENSAAAALLAFPPFMDYPWYKVIAGPNPNGPGGIAGYFPSNAFRPAF